MGYRKVPMIHTLDDFKEHPGLVVRMKGVSFGKVRQIIRMLDDESEDNDAMQALADEVAAHLVSWNLEDESGEPVPADAPGLDAQDFDFVMTVVNEWLEKMTGPGKDLGKDSTSGESFPGQPLTMEAL